MARALTLISAADDSTGSTFTWDGGACYAFASGTWDSATAEIQWSPLDPDSGTTLTPQKTQTTLTEAAPVADMGILPAGKIRVVIAGSVTAASLTVVLGRHK